MDRKNIAHIKVGKIIRNDEKRIQKTRFIIQSLFAFLCVWIGIEFYLFNQYLETNGAAIQCMIGHMDNLIRLKGLLILFVR